MAQYCCKWNDHVSNLITGLENLKRAESYIDVSLVCDGHIIKAHKIILSTCSALFHDMFVSNPCSHPIIILHDMKFSILQAIIDFIYRGEIKIQQDDLELLLKAAKSLGIKGLSDICREMLLGALVADMEDASQNNSAKNSTPDLSPPKKKIRKRSHDSNVDDKENLNLAIPSHTEENFEINASVSETCTVSVTSGMSSSNVTSHSVPNSMSETSTKKNAATNYEMNSFPEPHHSSGLSQNKSQSIDDVDGALMAKKTSYIWNFFTPLNDSIAECNTCLLNKSYKTSISNLKSHLVKKHPSIDLLAAKEMMIFNEVEESESNAPILRKKSISSQDMHLNCPKEAYVRKKTSYIWNYFTAKDDMTAECKACFALKSYKSSISNLKKHLLRRHPLIKLPSSTQHFNEDGESETSEGIRPRFQMGKKKSYLWNFFTPLNDELAECNICLKSKSYRTSISNLKSHLRKQHPSIDLTAAQELQEYAEIHRFKPDITITPLSSKVFEETLDEVTESPPLKPKKCSTMPIILKIT